jgi:hypothetical protein
VASVYVCMNTTLAAGGTSFCAVPMERRFRYFFAPCSLFSAHSHFALGRQ